MTDQTIQRIPTDKLRSHPANDAAREDVEHVRDLIESIEEFGQREPGKVRRVGVHSYQILSGHRRAAACRFLGIDFAAIVDDGDDTQATRDLILGNIRRDLDPIAKAELMRTAIDNGLARDEVARAFSISESHLADTLRLLELPNSLRGLVRDGILPVREARHFVPFAAATIAADRLANEIVKNREHMARGWKPHTVAESFRRLTRPCDRKTKHEISLASGAHPRRFEIDAETEARLDIVTLPIGVGRRKIPAAQNVVLWDRLQKKALKERGAATTDTVDPSDASDNTPTDASPIEDAATAETERRNLQIATERFWIELTRATIAEHSQTFDTRIAKELGAVFLAHLRGTRWLDIVIECLDHADDFRIAPRYADEGDTDIKAHADFAMSWGEDFIATAFAIITWPSGDTPIPDSHHDERRLPPGRPRSLPFGEPVNDKLWRSIAFRLGLDAAECWERSAEPTHPAAAVVEHWLRQHTPRQRAELALNLGIDGTVDSVDAILRHHNPDSPLPCPPITK